VLIAWAATVELRVADGLVAFDGQAWTVLAIALLASAALWLAASGAEPLGASGRAAILLLLFWPALWSVLRFGLPAADRHALGPFARKLRLV